MESQQRQKVRRRRTRALRVRKKIKRVGGSYPRLSVFKSNRHLAAQLIDDASGKTLCAVSTMTSQMRKVFPSGKGKPSAEYLGQAIAEAALAIGVSKVVFDRGHREYHGLIRALADSARVAGLQF
ncbi:50S ribosomal protein L18 [Candidatus Similichlamydia epinepheli]|uniref:50S ribosomal protein L18 n=1 Tax=Candidatus Similichlamydia epinepheli TaxID=1903953 RepID=UPI000D3724FA|nr:50S ribosomal protein L18 [Candidatus Similichlamydia epinepheli]